jgi:hypothetical protein
MPDIVERELQEISKNRGIILNQRFFVTSVGLATSNNHFIFPLADDVMQNLISAGIPQHLEKFHIDSILHPYQDDDDAKEPIVLSIDDLNFGFIIWLVTSGVSVAAFIFEILTVNSFNLCKFYFGLILFIKLLLKVMKP